MKQETNADQEIEMQVEVDAETYRWLVEHGDEQPVEVDAETLRHLMRQARAPGDGRQLAKRQHSPTVEQARQQLQTTIHRFLSDAAQLVAASVRQSSAPQKLAKGDRDVDLFLRNLPDIDWKSLVPGVAKELESVAVESARIALANLKITDQQMLSDLNETAADWAHDRAAELVGMKRLNSGRLVPNPDARWNISDHTRDEVRRIVEEGFEKKTTMAELADTIQSAGAFGSARAGLIANTEVIRSENQGNLSAWRQTGLVVSVDWMLSADHPEDATCECSDNADDGPYPVNEVPELPAHPGCWCSLVPALLVGQEEE